MIHAQQKGYSPAEILRGLCDAVARNFKSSIVKGRPVEAPVALIGAVSQNAGVTGALREAFSLAEGDLLVPAEYAWCGAIGAAILEAEEPRKRSILEIHRLRQHDAEERVQDTHPLSTENVVQLRDRVGVYVPPPDDQPIPAYLGLDIGSVSTNVVAIDEFGAVIHDVYLRTAGRPIEAVQQGLAEVERLWGSRLEIRGVGTTGSGRELIAEFVGADAVNDEITAHKTGAIHISNTLGGEPVDTIFEIGGQDSKFISIENGVVVDFAMNEACAAGTGSFLEEQAEKLGICIKGEFARLALSAASPTRLGERCTVFMERDVTGWLHKGETVPNLVAGLAYSIALNYLNRVVRGRKIGKVIYFQGGTAYNDAVTAAFASLLGKKITVPPYNGVMGAIGMALIARQWRQATRAADPFPRIRPAQAAAFHARLRLQGLLQPLRHEGVRHRGPEELLGRQVLRQVPQALGHRPQAGDRRPVRLPRSSCWKLCRNAKRQRLPGGPAARHVHARPAALLADATSPTWALRPCFRRSPTRASRRRESRWRWRSPATRCRWRTATCRRWWKRAWTTSWFPTWRTPDTRRGRTAGALLPVEPDAAVGAAVGAGARSRSQHKFLIPTLHFQLGPQQVKKALAETMRAHRRDAPRERPRRGRRLRRAARVPGQAAGSRAPGAGHPGRRPASRAWCWPAAATTSTTAA